MKEHKGFKIPPITDSEIRTALCKSAQRGACDSINCKECLFNLNKRQYRAFVDWFNGAIKWDGVDQE